MRSVVVLLTVMTAMMLISGVALANSANAAKPDPVPPPQAAKPDTVPPPQAAKPDIVPPPQECKPAGKGACPPPIDTDGDGVTDDVDQCDNDPGPASNNGCPLPPSPTDTDGDGFADSQEWCPNDWGPLWYDGCPAPPDTDGDGFFDEQSPNPNLPLDYCITEGELWSFVEGVPQGCPNDNDGDGISGFNELCISSPGTPENYGCPAGVTIPHYPIITPENCTPGETYIWRQYIYTTNGSNWETLDLYPMWIGETYDTDGDVYTRHVPCLDPALTQSE